MANSSTEKGISSRARFILVVGAIGVVLVILFALQPPGKPAPEREDLQARAPAVANASHAEASPPPAGADAEAARRAALTAAYAKLQSSRKDLQSALADLKSRLWGVELPAAQARAVSREMMAAQYLLREPRQLGAFSDARAIRAEEDRVQAALHSLQQVAATLRIPAP